MSQTTCYVGLSNIITVVFSNSLLLLPIITTLGSNGTISEQLLSGTNISFNWVPGFIETTCVFQFSNVTGTLTGSSLVSNFTVLPQTSVIISGSSYIGLDNTMTATFSTSQSGTSIPYLGSCINGVVSNINGSGNIFTFTWNPVNINLTNFAFNNVSGYLGILISW